MGALSHMEVSHVNLPIAVLIWLMIYPMMLRIDFAALRDVGRGPKGILIVLFVNWLVKPFSMAFLGWLVFKQFFAGIIGPELGDQYLAGTIILAAADLLSPVWGDLGKCGSHVSNHALRAPPFGVGIRAWPKPIHP